MSTDDLWVRPGAHYLFIHPDLELRLCWCPHCRRVLRGEGIHVFPRGGRHKPFCGVHADEDDLVPVTEEAVRAAFRLGGLDAASAAADELWPA